MRKPFLFLAGLALVVQAYAETTINGVNRHACSANLGWTDWRADTANGVAIGEYVCSGYIYAANVGWINLGNGTPANSVRYQNSSGSDYGVNHDGFGNLRGCAFGANIGWINFESTGAPKIDLTTGKMTGYVYSANCGWISLSNAVAHVQTETIAPGAMDGNGLPIAWELLNFGRTGVDPKADPDGDGVSNLQERLAGTNPNDPNDKLVITRYDSTADGSSTTLTWQSVPNRGYFVQKRRAFSPDSPWVDSGLGLILPDGGSTARTFADTNAPMGFYRIQAVRPLSP